MKRLVIANDATAVGIWAALPMTAPAATDTDQVRSRMISSVKAWRVALCELAQGDAVSFLGIGRGNGQRLALREAGQGRGERCRIEGKARGDGADGDGKRGDRRSLVPEVRYHELPRSREIGSGEQEALESVHACLVGEHAAGKADSDIGEHDRPGDGEDLWKYG